MKMLLHALFLFTLGIAAEAALSDGLNASGANQSALTNSPASDRSQQVHFEDGTTLTFLGLTHGQRHYPPGYEGLVTVNWIYTTNIATVAWIETVHDPNRYVDYELLVSDRANTACVPIEKARASHVRAGIDLQGFILKAFPRWEPETVLRPRLFRGKTADGVFIVTNAAHEPVPNWSGSLKRLPTETSDGDLQVTLSQLTPGVPSPRHPKEAKSPTDRAEECVRINFALTQEGQPAANWNPRRIQISDPSGNFVESRPSEYPLGGIFDYPRPGHPGSFETDGYYFKPGLWPDPLPWKVRMEFTRSSKAAFTAAELVTFTNVPVQVGTQQDFDDEWTWDPQKRDFSFVSGSANGVKLKLLPPLLAPDRAQPDRTFLHVIIYTEPNPVEPGLHLSLLRASDEQGREVAGFGEIAVWAGHYSFETGSAQEIKALNLEFALHKSRFAEFIVNPKQP